MTNDDKTLLLGVLTSLTEDLNRITKNEEREREFSKIGSILDGNPYMVCVKGSTGTLRVFRNEETGEVTGYNMTEGWETGNRYDEKRGTEVRDSINESRKGELEVEIIHWVDLRERTKETLTRTIESIRKVMGI